MTTIRDELNKHRPSPSEQRVFNKILSRAMTKDPLVDRGKVLRLTRLIQAGKRTSPEATRLGDELGLGDDPYWYPRRR